MKKEKPRKSIRRRVLAVLLCVSIAALLATDLLWLGSLFVVRNRVASDSSDLGETAYSVSVDTVTSLGEQNYIVTAENRAQTIDAILERYLGYVADFAFYAHRLLESPEEYVMKEVLPPHVSNAYHFVLQLCYADENADREALAPEVGLLANAVHIWQPVMESANSQIGSIYLCTESGFMINYDERSDLTPEIFDYFEKEWYTVPRDTGEVILTDAYEDAFGRGLMVTCESHHDRQERRRIRRNRREHVFRVQPDKVGELDGRVPDTVAPSDRPVDQRRKGYRRKDRGDGRQYPQDNPHRAAS